MASKILGRYPENADLKYERSIGSFDPSLLTYFLEGDQEKTERRKELGKSLTLTYSYTDAYNLHMHSKIWWSIYVYMICIHLHMIIVAYEWIMSTSWWWSVALHVTNVTHYIYIHMHIFFFFFIIIIHIDLNFCVKMEWMITIYIFLIICILYRKSILRGSRSQWQIKFATRGLHDIRWNIWGGTGQGVQHVLQGAKHGWSERNAGHWRSLSSRSITTSTSFYHVFGKFNFLLLSGQIFLFLPPSLVNM